MKNVALFLVTLSAKYFVQIHYFKLFDWFLASNQITRSSEFVRNKYRIKATK